MIRTKSEIIDFNLPKDFNRTKRLKIAVRTTAWIEARILCGEKVSFFDGKIAVNGLVRSAIPKDGIMTVDLESVKYAVMPENPEATLILNPTHEGNQGLLDL